MSRAPVDIGGCANFKSRACFRVKNAILNGALTFLYIFSKLFSVFIRFSLTAKIISPGDILCLSAWEFNSTSTICRPRKVNPHGLTSNRTTYRLSCFVFSTKGNGVLVNAWSQLSMLTGRPPTAMTSQPASKPALDACELERIW